jgi:CTP:molybdopterin cytidylyltransferase MocA
VASQRLAVHEHLRQQPGTDLMLLVADLPLLAADDIRPLLRAWAQRPVRTQAQVPVVRGARGHPVLLSWQAVQAIAGQPWPHGVREWMLANTGSTQWLQADRDAYVTDLDTPEDLQVLRSRLAGTSIAWPKPP